MHKHNVYAPVTEVVFVLHMAIIWQKQVDTRLELVTAILLVKIAQGFGCWQANQKVGTLLPFCQHSYPTGTASKL